jgi:uncharacterized protein (DUF2252 family)
MKPTLKIVRGHATPELPLSAKRDELAATGRALRARVPRTSHADWTEPSGRRDPVDALIEVTKGLYPELVPIRFGRMLQSPFTFFRGAASIMADDLARTATTGIRVQACGDCHLLNFGGFATPERRLVFDINDFDETLPAPWEWDVKRLATSFVLAAQDRRFGKRAARDAARAAVRGYRKWTAEYAAMPVLDAWYDMLGFRALSEKTQDTDLRRFRRKRARQALRHTSHDVGGTKLVTEGPRGPRIKDDPPLVFHRDRIERGQFERAVSRLFARYRESLPEERRVLVDRYRLVDAAVKVVGVGSVGTLCGVLLLTAGGADPLLLQVKQARASVLEPHAGACAHPNHGQRVVVGQRIMQAASDAFLGWTEGDAGRHFYVRQLHDAKIKPAIEVFDADALAEYARECGHALARAHARSGRAAAIAGYLGKRPIFDDAVTAFAADYAEQTARDHTALVAAVRAGRVTAVTGR